MKQELSGRVAIVTGGASGLGEGIVRKFVENGARVVVADVDDAGGASLVATLGDAAAFACADVSQPDQVETLVADAVSRFGRLDVMVNNAGVSGTMHPDFLADDLADFTEVLSVNLLGVMAGTKFAARQMATAGSGSIINLSSIGGIQSGGSVMSYRASKAGVIHFTKSVSIELAQRGIRTNCIAPGNIPTPLLAASAAKMGADAETFTAMIRSRMAANRPLEREGTADDVAEAALFLASDRSSYMTGTLLTVDGGTVAGPPQRPVQAPPVRATQPDQQVDDLSSITHA